MHHRRSVALHLTGLVFGAVVALGVMLAPVAAGGCASEAMVPAACSVGTDCNSGVCNADGTCAPAATGTGGLGGLAGSSSTGLGLGGPAGPAGSTSSTGTGKGGSGAGGAFVCSPNNDGMITRAEVGLVAGLHATFEVAEGAPVDMTGTMDADGGRVWDLTAALQGDHGELVETLSMAGQWFASSFPTASYAARLSDTSDLLGVFEISSSELLLRGVVSPTSASPKTILTYATPVVILAFPIVPNKTWTTTSSVTGTAEDVPIVGFDTEAYVSTVDAQGTLKTPFASFPVQRIRIDLTRTVGVEVTTVRTFSFITECFGTVANVVSSDNEQTVEFTTAAEVARLSP